MSSEFEQLKDLIKLNYLEEKWRDKIPDPTEIDGLYLEWSFKLPGKKNMKPQKEPLTVHLRTEKYASLNMVLKELKKQEGVNPLNIHLKEVKPVDN